MAVFFIEDTSEAFNMDVMVMDLSLSDKDTLGAMCMAKMLKREIVLKEWIDDSVLAKKPVHFELYRFRRSAVEDNARYSTSNFSLMLDNLPHSTMVEQNENIEHAVNEPSANPNFSTVADDIPNDDSISNDQHAQEDFIASQNLESENVPEIEAPMIGNELEVEFSGSASGENSIDENGDSDDEGSNPPPAKKARISTSDG
jgi:hypothetical protein